MKGPLRGIDSPSSIIKSPEICEIPRWARYKASLFNLNHDEFMATASADPNGILLDVRTSEEYHDNEIKGAININYLSENLADKLEELDNDNTYYVFCRTGRRSLRVCMLMKNSGFRVVNLDGGIMSSIE